MQRRHFLKATAALALQAPASIALATKAMGASGVVRAMARVRPSDAGWPGSEKWAALKTAVSGNLSEGQALFGPCASAEAAACTEVNANIHNPFFIGDQSGGTQVSGWLDAWRPAPSAYVVAARSAADAAAAVNFARDNNLRVGARAGITGGSAILAHLRTDHDLQSLIDCISTSVHHLH